MTTKSKKLKLYGYRTVFFVLLLSGTAAQAVGSHRYAIENLSSKGIQVLIGYSRGGNILGAVAELELNTNQARYFSFNEGPGVTFDLVKVTIYREGESSPACTVSRSVPATSTSSCIVLSFDDGWNNDTCKNNPNLVQIGAS